MGGKRKRLKTRKAGTTLNKENKQEPTIEKPGDILLADPGDKNERDDKDEVDEEPVPQQRVLRPRPTVQTGKGSTPLELGTIKLCLHLPGVFKMNIDIPQQQANWQSDFYNTFKNKYWCEVKRKKGVHFDYVCLLCGKIFQHQSDLFPHLNQHMGFNSAH